MTPSRLVRVLAAVLSLAGPGLLAAEPALDLAALKRVAVAQVEQRQVLVQQIVDQLFSYSELGFQEVETARYLTALLEQNGFEVERGVAGIPTAWVASWGSGKPVVGFMTDVDCIPRASQKPGVAYRAPLIDGAPGHGEGHNSGQAVNVVAALVLKQLMEQHKIAGTLRLYPGVAEELLAAKAYLVRAGLFKDVDLVLGVHVSADFTTSWGQWNTGLVSAQYAFHGKAAHAARSPWSGRSALDGVELMNIGWNYRREHLPLSQRSHYVVVNGGDQPNVVPSEASVWYYFRELDYPSIQDLVALGNTMADAAAAMSGTTVTRRIVGSAWPVHLNKVIAETQQRNIEVVGMPQWSAADQALARALQKEIGAKVEGLRTEVKGLDRPREVLGVSDDIGDVSWNVPTVYLSYPANIPNLPGHSWESAVAMATPLAHKGSVAGAKVQAMTALDFLLQPGVLKQAWAYFNDVQTKDLKYAPLMGPDDTPAVEMNKERMERFLPELRKHYYDPVKYRSYLEQLGIRYPTLRE